MSVGTPDFSTRPMRIRPWSSALEVALVVIATFVLAAAVRAAWSAHADRGAARGELEAARRQVPPAAARREVDELLASRALLTLDAPPARVLAELHTALPDDVRLESLTLAYARRVELEMQVVARSAAAYDRFLDRLAAAPMFDEVAPGGENRDGEVRAAVRMVRRGGAQP